MENASLPPLTTEQLAQRWDMTPETLDVWRQRGKGPKFFKVGDGERGRVLYSMDEVLKYERERTKNSTRGE